MDSKAYAEGDELTGPGHRLFGTGLAVAAGAAIAPHAGVHVAAALVISAYPGTTAPDWLEAPIGGVRLIPHRTVTHWLPLWLGLLGAGALLGLLSPLAGAVLGGFALGGLSHWFGDYGTPMGVPVLHPFRRRSARLWATGRGELLPISLAWLLAAGVLTLARL